jgi:cellulose biosynthesis protein BcsQ
MLANSIAFINQKGGVSKTVSAAAVLIEAARDKMRVLGADLDGKQRSLVRWAERRAQHRHLPQATVRAVTFSQAKLMAGECDLLVLDTPGWTDIETIDLAHFADLVVIPTTTNRDEMDPSALLVQALWKKEVHPGKVAVVLTRVVSETQEREAREFLAQIRIDPLRPSLADRPVWRAIGNDGRTICETGQKVIDDEGRAYVRSIGRGLERARRLQIHQAEALEQSQPRGRRR